jgi:WD40 repeat protein
MRAVAVSVVLAALAAGAASLAGAAPAAHRTASAAVREPTAPAWSPNGKQIAFGYARYVATCCGTQELGFRIVRRSSRAGGASRTVLNEKKGDIRAEEWVSGGRILFVSDDILKVVGVHGEKPERIVLPASCYFCIDPAFILSPDRKIAAVAAYPLNNDLREIELLNLTPRRPVVLSSPVTSEEESEGFDDEILAFSPDGSQLVFRRTGSDGSALMAFRLGSPAPKPLAQSGIPGASLVPSDVAQVQWSPDGRWVAFVEPNQNLEVVPTSGGEAPRILATANACDFSWSPTSKLIAYEDCATASPRLLAVKPDGTHLTDLLKRHRLAYIGRGKGEDGAQWSPDGSRLLFVAYGLDYHVWTIRPNGRDLIRRG